MVGSNRHNDKYMDEARKNYVKYLAAKHTAGTLEATEIDELVDTFTDEGFWVDSFLEVMDSESKTIEALSPMFVDCLLELGIEVPSQERYLWQIICYHTQRIIIDKVNPIEGVANLEFEIWNDPTLNKIYRATNTARQVSHYGKFYAVSNLVDYYWEWDDIMDRHFDYSESEMADIRREIEEGIKKEAKAWLATYGNMC